MATYSSILAWRFPWTEEPAGLQSMGSQRVWHNWATNTCNFHFTYIYIHIYIYIYVYMYICMYLYIHTYIYFAIMYTSLCKIYMYIYFKICIHLTIEWFNHHFNEQVKVPAEIIPRIGFTKYRGVLLPGWFPSISCIVISLCTRWSWCLKRNNLSCNMTLKHQISPLLSSEEAVIHCSVEIETSCPWGWALRRVSP